jgi:hypothetical protein
MSQMSSGVMSQSEALVGGAAAWPLVARAQQPDAGDWVSTQANDMRPGKVPGFPSLMLSQYLTVFSNAFAGAI